MISAEPRPFRFGILIETHHTTRAELLELAQRAQDAGCSIALGTDHFRRLAPLPLLQAVAEATSMRIGMLVLNNDLRHPVVLAHDLASLDLVTDGRLEIGLGAGWNREEYDAAGMAFGQPRERVDRLVASVGIIKQALRDGRIERPGDDAYPTIGLDVMPRSVQRPHPPILIGGGGPRVLRFAAREADIVGLDPRALPQGGHDPDDITEAAFDSKLEWIREAAGERIGQLDINVIIFDAVPEYPPARAERAGSLSADDLARSPHYLSGDTDRMVDQLLARRDRWGINYLSIRPPDLDALTPVMRRLAGR